MFFFCMTPFLTNGLLGGCSFDVGIVLHREVVRVRTLFTHQVQVSLSTVAVFQLVAQDLGSIRTNYWVM